MTDEQKIAHVVDMCHRFNRDFALSEIIARVVDERPELMFEFSEIWGKLVLNKTVRVYARGEPCTYQIASRGQW